MSTVSRNRSKPSVNPAPLELIARVREHDAQVKCLLDETKDIMKVHRESGSVSALVSKLFAQMRNLRNQSSADKKAKADVVSSRWQGDHNLLKKEKQCYNQEFKCCGRLHSVGKCECTTAHLDEQALNSWRLSACERILTAFVRYRDSARKFMTKDLLTKNVVDGVVDSVTKRRQSVANGLPLSAAMQQLQQTDENLLKSMIVNIISDFTNGQNKKPIPHLNCMFKTAVGGFLQNCSLDDLLWFTCKIMEAPWLGVDWIPSLLRKVILSHCDSNLKKGFESFCRFMFVVLEMSSLYAEPKGDPVEESESWVVVEPVLNQDTRCGPVSEETIRLYFNLLDVNGLGAFSEKIQSREQLTSLEKWTLYTSLTQYMVCLTEATLKKFVDRRCYDTAMYISLVTACWINWLYYVRNDLAGDLQSENDRSIAEEMYIRLSGYKVIVSVEKYTLWQSFLSMPIPLGEPIDEWRLLYVLFRQGKDEIADVMQMPLPRLKGLVRETVRNTKYGVHSNPEIVHFYNTVCAILERLKNPDTVSITILALLLRAFSSEDDIERVTFEKNMLSILLSSPLCAEQFIPAMDECLKRMPSANCANIINVLSFEHLRLNNKTWPILKSWLRHGVESKQFALAERIVAELGLGHYTLADDAFTAELVDVLSLLFRKHVTDCKLSKESIANKMSLSGSRNGRFEQFCWSVVACVKVTKRSRISGQRRALRTFFPTKHSLFEAFVHFQSGNESEISVEDFLKAVTELRIPAAVLPCAIYLLRKFLEDETAVLPSAAKFREWMDCLLCSASDGLVEFPLPELFSHQLSQIIAEYKETKPSKCKDVTTFLFSTISPVRNAAWRQSSGHVPLMDSCSRTANTVGDGGYNFLSQLLFESGFTSSNEEVLKDLVKGFDCFKVTHARGHCSLKYPDIAFTYATKVHDYVMTMDSSVSERPIWRLAVGHMWCFICSTVCHHRLFLLLTSLRRLYEVVTSDESFTGRELNDLATDMVKFLESKNCQFLKVSRQQLYSSLVEWIKDSISFLHETSDLLCFPRSASLETLLMSYEDLTYENDGVVAQSGPSAPVATAANLGGYTSQMYLIEQEIIANVATPTKEDEKPAENDCKTLRDGKKITAWSDVTIIEVLTECIERLKENVSVFKEIEKSLAVMCDGFAASVKMSNLYVCTPISKKLTYSPNLTVCPLCQSEAPAELIVIDHKLDFVKEELLDKAWYSMLRTLDRHFDDFVDDFCDNFSLFACLVQEYSRRSENRIQASLTYDEAEKSKLMDLMIAASACDEAVLPPEMCNFVAKSLRQVVVKAFLRRYRNYEANEILRTIFADSNTFSLVIQDLPVNLLTMDQFFVAYESFLRVLALPEGEDLDCCMVMNVLDVARLEPELTSSTVMSFLTLILSTYRDSKSLTYRNPEMCSVFNSHVRFLLLCNEMAHFESGLTLLVNEYFADCSQLLKETVSDLSSTPKIDMLRFEVVCNCLDCLNDCTPSSDGIAIALTLYYICLHRKVDLWKAAMEKEGVVPTVEELDATVDKAYSFAAVRIMMRRDIDPRQWCTLLEQYYLIVRCLSNFFIETKCDIVENTLLLLLIAGLSYFNSTYLDERAKKVMDDYATEIKWNTVVPTLEIINCFISFIASAKRKQKVFFIRVVVQLRWTEFVRSSLETLDSSMPVIARALELLFSCIFCNDAQPHSSSLVDLLDLFKLVPKATIVGENRQQLLLYFSRRATCCHLCREESAPQNAAFRALKHLMCFDGVGGQHTCAEVCTDSQRALLDVILEIFKHRSRDSPAKKLIDAQWTPLLEDICACINLAENRFVHINRGKLLFNSVVSYLVDGEGNKAFLIDATIQWMKTSPANAYLIYVLNSLSENLSSKPDVCLSLAEECLKAYFANLISASWSDVVANFSLTNETSNDLPAKCRQKCLYWVLYSHLLSRLYSDDSDTDTADLALQCVSVCNELIDKQADELLCVMYLLLLVNTLSAMVERCCTLTVGVFKQLCTCLSALRPEYQCKGLIASVSLWKKPTRPTRFFLLCGILEVFIVTRLQSDLSLQDVYAEEDKDAISMQTLKETAIFEAYTNTIDLAAEMMTNFQESGGMINLHTFVSKVALALYSERCINDRCIA